MKNQAGSVMKKLHGCADSSPGVVTMNNNEQDSPVITEEQVVGYLRAHPEFFLSHDDLLREITIPHNSGQAISLVERQVHVFREQRDQLRKELGHLVAIARDNDRFFEKSKRLLMNLLEAKSLEEVVIMVEESIRTDFGLDFSSLLLFGDATEYPICNVQMVSAEEATRKLGDLMTSSKAVCGRLRKEQAQCLFPAVTEDIGSAAVISLQFGEVIGMFSLGSKDQHYFDKGMGSLFLSYISDTLSRLLPPLLDQERRGNLGKRSQAESSIVKS
jgi:hypothetical protein